MIGIDIGSKSIKIIELVKNGSKFDMKSSGAVGYSGPSPDKMIDDKSFKDFSDIIRKIINQIGIVAKDVNISLPESLVFTRIIKFPLLTDEEIASAVKWEAEQYIPISLSEAVIQYSFLERNESTRQISILLVATPKAVVEKYINVIQHAGLNAVAAETELTALSRSVSPEKGISLLLDIGSSASDMAITSDGKIIFTRSIPVAGDAFTRAVSQGLGINMQQAEEYKRTYGLTTTQLEGKVRNTLEPIMTMIIDEIKKATHFFQAEEKREMPSSIVVSGGASTMPDIVSFFTENLGIETVIGNPFAKINIDEATAKNLAPFVSLYGTAVGLAMREE